MEYTDKVSRFILANGKFLNWFKDHAGIPNYKKLVNDGGVAIDLTMGNLTLRLNDDLTPEQRKTFFYWLEESEYESFSDLYIVWKESEVIGPIDFVTAKLWMTDSIGYQIAVNLGEVQDFLRELK